MQQQFWKLVFCESDGSPSFSRVASGLLIVFACGWITSLVLKNHAIPDLAGIALLIGVPYGVNKLGIALSPKQ